MLAWSFKPPGAFARTGYRVARPVSPELNPKHISDGARLPFGLKIQIKHLTLPRSKQTLLGLGETSKDHKEGNRPPDAGSGWTGGAPSSCDLLDLQRVSVGRFGKGFTLAILRLEDLNAQISPASVGNSGRRSPQVINLPGLNTPALPIEN